MIRFSFSKTQTLSTINLIVELGIMRIQSPNKAVYTAASVAYGWAGAVWHLGRGSKSNMLSFQL